VARPKAGSPCSSGGSIRAARRPFAVALPVRAIFNASSSESRPCANARGFGRTVTTCRIDGNPRYSWIKNQRSLFVSRTRPCSLRLKTFKRCRSTAFPASSRNFDSNGEARTARTKQNSPHHSASLGDFITSSTRIRFSVHTTQQQFAIDR
jgi:hypothetical protein